jgi:hypothetical protein
VGIFIDCVGSKGFHCDLSAAKYTHCILQPNRTYA